MGDGAGLRGTAIISKLRLHAVSEAGGATRWAEIRKSGRSLAAWFLFGVVVLPAALGGSARIVGKRLLSLFFFSVASAHLSSSIVRIVFKR